MRYFFTLAALALAPTFVHADEPADVMIVPVKSSDYPGLESGWEKAKRESKSRSLDVSAQTYDSFVMTGVFAGGVIVGCVIGKLAFGRQHADRGGLR